MALPERQGLYDPRNEHDSCGIGFVANIKGRKSHDIIARGLVAATISSTTRLDFSVTMLRITLMP